MKTTVANKLAELVKLATEINLDNSIATQVFVNITPHIAAVHVTIYPVGWSEKATGHFEFLYYWNKGKQDTAPYYKSVNVQRFQEVMKILNDIKNHRSDKKCF